ncbi:hypothetical protein V1264_010812 [Littorina saxatilis]|uniref:BTB domain-containing protein n=2 Tax=Littorina saxatilis TaxID=31220 RepID=A0AAN9BSS5_9CAEN
MATRLPPPTYENCDEHEYFGDNDPDHAITFRVGDERKLLVGQKFKMAEASPIFSAMFRGPWRRDTEVEIPDLHPDAFRILLRHSEGDQSSRLTDSNAWHVLKAADKYQVTTLVTRCFHFLLHTHSAHQTAQHMTAVLELAHHLNYAEDFDRCLNKVKTAAGKVLRSSDALSQLCYDCFFRLVEADDLAEADEVVVYQAVVTWASSRCRRPDVMSDMTSLSTSGLPSKFKPESKLTSDKVSHSPSGEASKITSEMVSQPTSEVLSHITSGIPSGVPSETMTMVTSWQLASQPKREEASQKSKPELTLEPKSKQGFQLNSDLKWRQMRAVAGELVYHVRYLAIPRFALERLLSEPSNCLLTEQEVDDLTNHNGSQTFPESVGRARKETTKKILKAERDSRQRNKFRWCVLAAAILLLTFLVHYLFIKFLVKNVLPEPQVHDSGNATHSECGGQAQCS